MHAMNGYRNGGGPSKYINSQTSSYHLYQSTGDLRSLGPSRGSSFYDLPTPGMSSGMGSRQASSALPLSSSMTNLNQPVSYQHMYPPSAGSYQVQPQETSTAYRTDPRQSQQRHLSTASVGTGKRRRQRPSTTASAGNWFTDNESVFSEPPLQLAQTKRKTVTSTRDTRLRPQQSRPYRQPSLSAAHSMTALNRLSPEPSVIDPELRNVDKAGDQYHITMSLNAALKQAELEQQHVTTNEQYEVMSRQVTPWNQLQSSSHHTSRIDLTADDMATTNEQIVGTKTVIHLNDNLPEDNQNVEPSLFVKKPNVTRGQRFPSISSVDGGYRIKSVKSMTDLRDLDGRRSVMSTLSRRGDDKIGFDVELDEDRPRSVALVNDSYLYSSRPQSVAMETRTVQKVSDVPVGRQQQVLDGNSPNYTMTLNDTMSMSYAPSIADTQPIARSEPPRKARKKPKSEDEIDDEDSARNEPVVKEKASRPQRAARKPKSPLVNSSTQMSDTELRMMEPRRNKPPKPDVVEPEVFLAEQINRVQAPAPKVVSEQATQASELPRKSTQSTQTIKNRGTQTEQKSKPIYDDEDIPLPTMTRQPLHAPAPRPRSPIPKRNDNRVERRPAEPPKPDNNPSWNKIKNALNAFDDEDNDDEDIPLPTMTRQPLHAPAPRPRSPIPKKNDNRVERHPAEPPKADSNSSWNKVRNALNTFDDLLDVNPEMDYTDIEPDNAPFVKSARKPREDPEDLVRALPTRNTYAPAPAVPVPRPIVNGNNAPRMSIPVRKPPDQTDSRPFGYQGGRGQSQRTEYARRLTAGAPAGSITRREHRKVEEEEIAGSMIGLVDGRPNQSELEQDSDAVLNLDSISEKVDLVLADGIAELTVIVRCENIVPVIDTSDLFKKSTIIVTKVIEVDLMVTEERRKLYDQIVTNQDRSSNGRLSNRDTFDLYQIFIEMSKQDELEGYSAKQPVRIDRRVDEQRFLDLQLDDRHSSMHDPSFDRVDDQLNTIQPSRDVDVRAQSSRTRRAPRY